MKKLLFLGILGAFSSGIFAGDNFNCTSERLNKMFVIKGHSVAFFENVDEGVGRAVASVQLVRTRRRGNSITKIAKFEGKKFYIHIENTSAPTQIDDYVAIKSNKGHEIIYPIDCK